MKRMVKTAALATLLLVALAGALPQDNSPGYVLRSVSYEITGRTKEYFLAQKADFQIGQVFADKAALDVYVANKSQLLVNERVLDTVEIVVTVGEAVEGEAALPVDLVVRTKDTWNIIALPYFRYDSNSGLLLSIRARDYDFLGTMQTLALNVNYIVDEHGQSSPGVQAAFTIPFPALGLDWLWDADAALDFPAGEPADIVLSTGVSTDVPVGPFILTLSTKEYFYAGQKDSTDTYYDDPYYFATNLGADFMATLYESGSLGKLLLGPQLDFDYRYAPGGLIDTSLQSTPSLTPALVLSFGRYNWLANFRSGLKADAAMKFVFNLNRGTTTPYFVGSLAGYTSLGWAGPSARLSGIWYLESQDSAAGDYLRGILDLRIKTDAAIFLNLDFPIRVLDFDPATWFKQAWMRFFRFEFQLSPFLDLGLTHDGVTGRWFNPADGWYGGGVEALIFPKLARSFYLRVSAGWCLTDLVELKSLSGSSPRDGKDIKELFIGFGHFY